MLTEVEAEKIVLVHRENEVAVLETVWTPDNRLARVTGRTAESIFTDLGIFPQDKVTPARVTPMSGFIR